MDPKDAVLFRYLSFLSDVRQSLRWHQAKGMRPATVPPYSPGVAILILREGARAFDKTHAEFETCLDTFEEGCMQMQDESNAVGFEASKSANEARMIALVAKMLGAPAAG